MLAQELKKEEVKKLNGDYIFSPKFDGERGMVFIENGRISKIINRRGKNILKQFIEFKDLTFNFNNGVIDSEIIVVVNGRIWGDFSKGIALRTHLENEREILERSKELRAKIMAFDILNLNGEDLKFKPLIKRIEILEQNIKDNDLIEVVKSYENFDEIWKIVEQYGLEGVIAKNKQVAYESVRSRFWLKIKNWKEKVIGFDSYDIVNGEKFYKGITLTNKEGVRCACLGKKSDEVREIIDREGKIDVVVQYLEKTSEKGHRFITFKEVVKNGKRIS